MACSKHKLASLIMALVVTACAAPEMPPPGADQRLAAAEYALAEAYASNKLFELCRTMGSYSADQADVLEAQWYLQNGPYVAAADSEYASHFNAWQKQFGDKAARTRPVMLVNGVEKQRQHSWDMLRRYAGDRDKRCVLAMQDRVQESALNTHLQYGSILTVMRGEFEQAKTPGAIDQPVAVLLDYQKDLRPLVRLEGKMLFGAEKLVSQQCTPYTMVALDQRHDVELYGVRCGDDRLLALQCLKEGCHFEGAQP